jgi:hypothetical protein
MSARLAADLLLSVHLLFVVFVVFGGLLALWRAGFAWLHLPALAWGLWIETSGRICPLTPWENQLRQIAGQSGYSGGFVEHYLLPIVYPPGLTLAMQNRLAIALGALNLLVYGLVIARKVRSRRRQR